MFAKFLQIKYLYNVIFLTQNIKQIFHVTPSMYPIKNTFDILDHSHPISSYSIPNLTSLDSSIISSTNIWKFSIQRKNSPSIEPRLFRRGITNGETASLGFIRRCKKEKRKKGGGSCERRRAVQKTAGNSFNRACSWLPFW